MQKILVIEDDPNILDNIVDVLEVSGFDTTGVQHGQQGIEYAKEIKPDLIICDVMLPDMNGYDLLQKVRNIPELKTTTFIFLTAMSERSDMRKGMMLGADDYITKPFTMDELIDAINIRLIKQEEIVSKITASLEETKRSFARSIAHELRTPLASLRMVEEIIAQRLQMSSDEDADEFMNIVQSSNNRMGHLIDQMVLVTEIDLGLLDKQSIEEYKVGIPILKIVEKSIRKARKFVSKNHNIEVNLNVENSDLIIFCDQPSFIHALAEIIANSIHFCNGNSIEVFQWVEDMKVYFNVIDRGHGMTSSQVYHALVPFQQVNRHEQEQQGVGMGLPLAKKIVELHLGDFTISSELDSGTQVLIMIPTS